MTKRNVTSTPSQPVKFFHEVSDTQWKFLLLKGGTWRELQQEYRQPTWCTYPGGLDGMRGCWSLTGRMVTGEDYCRSCDLHKDHPDNARAIA